jgi:hypothetical protein
MEKKRRAGKQAARQTAVKKPKEPTPLDLLKLEIAAELGLSEKVASEGWGELTAAETGRVGGILNKRLRDKMLAIGPRGTLVPLQ